MAWKLKKATPERDGGGGEGNGVSGAAEGASLSAGEQTIDYSALPSAEDASMPEHFAAHSNGADFLGSRIQAADDAVDAFAFAQQSAPAPAKSAESHDDWSLDAFAPYQPPAAFDFNDPLAEQSVDADAGLTHAGTIDFDAEPVSLLGTAGSTPTSLYSSELPASEFKVVDFDSLPSVEAPSLHHGAEDSVDELGFATIPSIAGDLNENWQIGDAGALDSSEAMGTSAEPTLLSGMALPVSDAIAPPPAMSLPPQPAFDEPGEALTALHNSIPETELHALQPSAAPEPEPEPVRADIDKTLLYGEASDSPGIADPQSVPAASLAAVQPQLVVKFGPFTANYPITADDLVIGRPDPKTGLAPNVSLEYDDAVSRRHARVYSDGGQVMLEDLGSKNGTLLNNSPVPPHQPMPLKPNDKIRVGERTEIDFQQ